MSPRARGLALGYMLSPAYAGLSPLTQCNPGLADSPWAICCRPLRGLPAVPSLWMRADQLRPGQGIISNNDAVSSVPCSTANVALTPIADRVVFVFLTSTIHSRIMQ